MLPTDAKARKDVPIATGVLDYFKDAIAAVAAVSKTGNEQHNPGKPLHWDRSKSTDEADALARHFLERGKFDTDGHRHSAKVAWRALALLQKEIEADPSEIAEYPDDHESRWLVRRPDGFNTWETAATYTRHDLEKFISVGSKPVRRI